MEVLLHTEAAQVLASLVKGKHSDPRRAKRIARVLDMLAADPRSARLSSHRYELLDKVWGVPVWQSYVEVNVPSAWRIWWYYGPESGQITVIGIGPHPD